MLQEPPPPPPPSLRKTSPGRTTSPTRSIIAGAGKHNDPRRAFVVTLKRDDNLGGFGVNLDAASPRTGRRAVTVSDVTAGSSAALAGVLPGDELLAVAGFGVEGKGPGGLRKALTHLLAEERRLQELYGQDTGTSTSNPHAAALRATATAAAMAGAALTASGAGELPRTPASSLTDCV